MFNNKTLKKIDNKTINKPIKIRLKFKIYKLLIFFHIINKCISLIFNFVWTIEYSSTSQYNFIKKIR